MNRGELVGRVATRAGCSRAVAREVVDAVLGGVVAGLCAGRRVELRGLGTFRLRRYDARLGRNPREGTRVAIPSRVRVVFRPSAALQRRLRAGPVGGGGGPGREVVP